MQSQPTDSGIDQRELRRLLAERASKQRELDAIDRAIEVVAGVVLEDRPKRPSLSRSNFRHACGV